MIEVKVDLIPGGMESARQTLTSVFVGNDGTGGHSVGNYDVYTQDPRGRPYPREDRPGWVGRIENFDRSLDGRGRDLLAAKALELVREATSG